MSRLFRSLMGLFLLGFVSMAQAASTDVYDVRVGVQSQGARLVIESTKPVNITVTDGNQGVVSMGPFNYVGKPPFVAGTSGVDKIVLEPDSGLVILSFVTPMRLAQRLTLPSMSQRNANRFVFDFLPAATKPDNNTEKGRVLDPPQTLGQLRTTRPAPASPPVVPTPTEIQVYDPAPPIPPAPANLSPLRRQTTEPMMVVIDAGHGGKDPGARSPSGIVEKNVTLSMSKILGEELRRRGHNVHLTRDSDIFIPLRGRIKIAQKKDADLFISIHADSMGNGSRTTRGASVYTLSDTASDKETAALAARENQVDVLLGVDLSHEDKDVANILIDLAMRDTMNQSKKLANTLVMQLSQKGVKTLSPAHRFAGFAVLKAADVPSILIEMGFLSNPDEADALNDPVYRAKLASTIADTVDTYGVKYRPQE